MRDETRNNYSECSRRHLQAMVTRARECNPQEISNTVCEALLRWHLSNVTCCSGSARRDEFMSNILKSEYLSSRSGALQS